nr:hypothetical protein [Tanacetum cinerariifolium]
MDHKTKLNTTTKNHQASIQNLEAKFDRFADKQSAQPSGSLPNNTQPNPKGSSSKPCQPPQARNEHLNFVFTCGKSYDPPTNPNDQQNNSKTPINFDSEDEDEESTPQPKSQTPKLVKETPIPKSYKPKITYLQRLRKEKMETRFGKFLDMIQAVRINVPFVAVLAGMPNYENFLKELVPPKLGDPGSFLIPYRSFQYHVEIAENMLVEVRKFTFPVDFVILEMEEESKVPLILGRPFLHTADAVIRVKQKQLNLGVGTDRMIFHINSAMKHSY